MSSKRTLDAFFGSPSTTSNFKRPRTQVEDEGTNKSLLGDELIAKSHHFQYPFPIPELPPDLSTEILSLPAREGKVINDQPHLDLLYFQPFVPGYLAKRLFDFFRSELPFYRVEYDINRGGITRHIRTPRWTTVFGLDETSVFDDQGMPVDAKTKQRVRDKNYDKYPPRPVPACLDELRKVSETATGCQFNFCLVNYYASGADSISYHSDDERFLGIDPAIASFTFGARRDFLMKHKPPPPAKQPGELPPTPIEAKPLKLPLGSGDMVLMRGKTQNNWLHSIPKRSGKNEQDGGRINITFRRAMVKDGTENYYNYNVGNGHVYKWDKQNREMALWKKA